MRCFTCALYRADMWAVWTPVALPARLVRMPPRAVAGPCLVGLMSMTRAACGQPQHGDFIAAAGAAPRQEQQQHAMGQQRQPSVAWSSGDSDGMEQQWEWRQQHWTAGGAASTSSGPLHWALFASCADALALPRCAEHAQVLRMPGSSRL